MPQRAIPSLKAAIKETLFVPETTRGADHMTTVSPVTSYGCFSRGLASSDKQTHIHISGSH